ncbi:hypothetical protein N5V81_14035 [Escherichia coli]|nr:hypothetical protein [Escherichia coli]
MLHEDLDAIDETALPEITGLTFQRRLEDSQIIAADSIDVRMGVCETTLNRSCITS